MEINKELLTLQDELSKLESAVNHIAKAEKLSTNVIESAKIIQEDFSRKLEDVIAHYNEYMSRTSSNTEDNISEVSNTLLKLADEVRSVTADYTKLSQSTILLSEKIDSINFPQHLSQIEVRTDEIKSLTADLLLSQQQSSSDLKSAINKELDNFLAKQYELNETIAKINTSIIKASEKQVKAIDDVNLKVTQQEEMLSKLTELIEKQTHQIGTLKIFSITTFVLLVIFFAILMIK